MTVKLLPKNEQEIIAYLDNTPILFISEIECKCNEYIWNFGDPMAHMIDRGSNRVGVNRIKYNTLRIRKRDPMRDTEDIIQENRFYENGVIKV